MYVRGLVIGLIFRRPWSTYDSIASCNAMQCKQQVANKTVADSARKMRKLAASYSDEIIKRHSRSDLFMVALFMHTAGRHALFPADQK
jgi:hypothetical protein